MISANLLKPFNNIITVSILSQTLLCILVLEIGLSKFSVLVVILTIFLLLGHYVCNLFLLGQELQRKMRRIYAICSVILLSPFVYFFFASYLELGCIFQVFLICTSCFDNTEIPFWVYTFIDNEEELAYLYDLRIEWRTCPPSVLNGEIWQFIRTLLYVISSIIQRQYY